MPKTVERVVNWEAFSKAVWNHFMNLKREKVLKSLHIAGQQCGVPQRTMYNILEGKSCHADTFLRVVTWAGLDIKDFLLTQPLREIRVTKLTKGN